MQVTIDPRALQILRDTYWTGKRWIKDAPGPTPPADWAHARRAGLMFDPITIDHDGVVAWVLRVRAAVTRTAAATAFLASLSSRRLDLRSALATAAVAWHFPAHSFEVGKYHWCAICAGYRTSAATDLNVLNFERFQWGGVRHLNPVYVAFDLERLAATEPLAPSDQDVEILREILATVRSVPPKTTPTALAKLLGSVLPSNEQERRTLLGILAVAGILAPAGHPGFRTGFARASERGTKGEWPYPMVWWCGLDGVDDDAVADWFPQLGR